MTKTKIDKTVHMKRLDDKRCRELQVYYDAGGQNYWNGSTKRKGIYFASHCFEQAKGSRTQSWSTGQKGDGYILVVPLERYSAKQLRLVYARVAENAEMIHGFLDRGDRLEALIAILRGSMEIVAVA